MLQFVSWIGRNVYTQWLNAHRKESTVSEFVTNVFFGWYIDIT